MIHLYAEHLLNIRTLSIQASLSTVSSKETKATLSADGSILTLEHEGESASIKLPINLSPNRQSTVKLTIPAVPSRELSFRIQLEAKEGVQNGVLGNGAPSEDGNVNPWTADSLTTETEICCKVCNSLLVQRGKVREWKDLPSEGWAEMMEFWHCHKPDEPQTHDHAHSKKGYSADSQLALWPGVSMVGVIDFVFAVQDCENVEVLGIAETSGNNGHNLSCSQCRTLLGQIDISSGGYHLRKSQLALSTSDKLRAVSFSEEKWLSCQLLSATEDQGVRKFVVHGPGKPALRLWIFTPDLSVSSSLLSSTDYVRVVKVMWQGVTAPHGGSQRFNGAALYEGELKLHGDELVSLRRILDESGRMLPEEARTFQEWHVGLLRRFTKDDIG